MSVTGGRDLEQAITVLRARIDEEFRISERIDAKQRQAFAISAGFYAVVQTIAFGGFGNLNGTERPIIAVCAAIAGLIVVEVAHRLNDGEELRGEADFKPAALQRWINEADDEEEVLGRIVGELVRVAEARHAQNTQRGFAYDRVTRAARWSLIITGVEMLIAVSLRV